MRQLLIRIGIRIWHRPRHRLFVNESQDAIETKHQRGCTVTVDVGLSPNPGNREVTIHSTMIQCAGNKSILPHNFTCWGIFAVCWAWIFNPCFDLGSPPACSISTIPKGTVIRKRVIVRLRSQWRHGRFTGYASSTSLMQNWMICLQSRLKHADIRHKRFHTHIRKNMLTAASMWVSEIQKTSANEVNVRAKYNSLTYKKTNNAKAFHHEQSTYIVSDIHQ